MRAYTVHAPADDPAAPEKFAFVKDGFSWPALFAPILWILWHRLWLTLVGYVIFVLVVAWTGRLVNENAAFIVAILGSLLFALEANNIRRLSLANRGWSDLGASSGQNLDEAELRFFDRWRNGSAAAHAAPTPIARNPDARLVDSEGPIFGLFPEPER
jgi:Protein of unknown function (DUF2628)